MDWQQACLQSKEKKAIRRNQNKKLVIRYWDGSAIVQTNLRNSFRDALPKEIEGYLDWEPY